MMDEQPDGISSVGILLMLVLCTWLDKHHGYHDE